MLAAEPLRARRRRAPTSALPGRSLAAAADWELRAFFANQHGAIVEDPVTGSFNAGVALHLFANGPRQRTATVAAQGRQDRRRRAGRMRAGDADGRVWIGGRCATIASGAALPLFAGHRA